MGSGFKTFTAGEVLTASDVNNYLMEQSVMTFGGSAARSSAIGTANFEEGMVSYLTDTDKVEAYNGTDWVSVAPTSTQGLTLINTTTFSGVASQAISDVFSATYTNYRIIINVQSATSQVEFLYRMRVSGTDYSGADYYSQLISGNSSSVTGERVSQGTSGTLAQITNNQSGIDAVFYRPFEAVRTMVTATSANSIDTIRNRIIGSVLADSVSYTGLTLVCSQNITGTISIYGLAK
jgi:hypothetical protein